MQKPWSHSRGFCILSISNYSFAFGEEPRYHLLSNNPIHSYKIMILIPLNRAIQLLENRLQELNRDDIDLEAWKNRTVLDIQGIFGKISSEWLGVSGISVLHFNDDNKKQQIKETFRQTLSSYVQYINDFHLIAQEKVELSEEKYKAKYSELLQKWNDLVPDYNKLLGNYQELHKEHDRVLTEVKILQEKLSSNESSTEFYKILFLAANPINEVRLRVDEEVRDIEHGLRLAALRDNFGLVQKWAVTPKSLQQAMLDEQPQIVHFSGHGDTTGIAVEDVLGNAKIIDKDALGSLFKLFSDSVQCVFLNSCYSEAQAQEIAKHIPYVIGMKSSVPDRTAIAFSVSFYTALGAGKDIRFAYKLGLVSIQLEGIEGGDTPVLIG